MSPFASNHLIPTQQRALVVMARLPRPGHCKTRLCPPFSPEDAAGIYRAFLTDIGRLLDQWDADCDLWIAWVDDSPGVEHDVEIPEEAPEELQAIFPPSCRFLRQTGGGLAERMERVFDRLFEAGYRQVVMRNSDSPHLPLRILDGAFAALDDGSKGSVVIGPDLDGGYYLLGLDAPPKGLLPTRMSTGSVLDQTLAAAEAQRRTHRLLEPFLDVDSPEDLRIFWLEFGGRSDVRDWATWRRLAATDLSEHLE